MDTETIEWIKNAKKALAWFIEIIGEDEWKRRRKNVIDYFNSLDNSFYSDETTHNEKLDKIYRPVAFYDDWMSWYMYLIESLLDRPTCDDPMQSARIKPFFITIGKHLDALKGMPGVDKRILILLNEQQNQPDSTLFELVVAIGYSRNGWNVAFLDNSNTKKSADLLVTRGLEKYYVECKRLAKVNKYAEDERLEWQKRSKHLFDAMHSIGVPAFATINFKIPLEVISENYLSTIYLEYFSSGKLRSGEILMLPELDFKAIPIDFESVAQKLSSNSIRNNSPELIILLTGEYEMHGNYTTLIAPTGFQIVGEDNGLYILNKFIDGLQTAYVAKWDCMARSSIDSKAKDIKKTLSKAVSQIPDHAKGIIHIGYETVSGPYVEAQRYDKLVEAIQTFNYGSKLIECIFCHAFQSLIKINEWECAETVSYFGEKALVVLGDVLLIDLPTNVTHGTTHWQQDIENIAKSDA